MDEANDNGRGREPIVASWQFVVGFLVTVVLVTLSGFAG